MIVDAVLSQFTNPYTSGVAKFNHLLAKKLNVPLLPLDGDVIYPLVSIKCSESPSALGYLYGESGYELFLHDVPSLRQQKFLKYPVMVYAANAVIAEALRQERSDVITAFCPSTIDGNSARGAYRVLVFGMAHKLVLSHFEHLKAQLEVDHPDYTLSLSTAVHEGSPWEVGLHDSIEAMRAIFGDRLRVLGFLADDALAKELQESDAVAAFFQPAVRANNTTVWAALAAGKQVYTNVDADSPNLSHPERYSWNALLTLFK